MTRWPKIGTKVREPEGRHIGTLVAIVSSQAIVKWDDNGWQSEFNSPAKLEVVPASDL